MTDDIRKNEHAAAAETSSAVIDLAMERYAAGDDAAFALLYDSLAPRILGYLARRTRDWADAEDILQQTMLHVHRSREAFIPGSEVAPWAFAIARHLLVDRSRRRNSGQHFNLELEMSAAPAADELLHARELAVRVEKAVSELPPSQRTVLALVRENGLSFAEVAQVLGTTVGAARARACRAYEAIRSELSRAGASLRRGAR